MQSEAQWLQSLPSLLSQHGVDVDLADDAAWLPDCQGGWQVVSTDMLVEGIHFNLTAGTDEWSTIEDMGWKAAAVSLSDMAACGAEPLGLLLAVGIPSKATAANAQQMIGGVLSALKQYQCPLMGGDTVASPQWTVTTTVWGRVLGNQPKAHRGMAHVGDVVAICGWHGLSAVGLSTIQQQLPGFSAAKQWHKRPMPMIRSAQALGALTPRMALMDTSDGLADAALKIASASRVQLILQESKIPVHPELSAFCSHQVGGLSLQRQWMLYGGEDFGLLACVPPNVVLPPDWTAIGCVTEAQQNAPLATLITTEGLHEPLIEEKAFQHFGEGV